MKKMTSNVRARLEVSLALALQLEEPRRGSGEVAQSIKCLPIRYETWVWIFRTHLLPRADWPDDLVYLESSRSMRILSQLQVPWGMTQKFDLWPPHIHAHTCSHRNTHTRVRVHWKQNWGELIKVLQWDKMTTTKITVHDSVLKMHCSKETRESSSSLVFFLPWDQRHTPLIPTFRSWLIF